MNIDSLIKKTLHQSIQSQIPYSTGLNSAYKLVLADGSKVFIKYQKKADELLLKEAKELQLLEQFIKVLFLKFYTRAICKHQLIS